MSQKSQIELFISCRICGKWHFFISDEVLWHIGFVLVKGLASFSRLQRKCFKIKNFIISFPGYQFNSDANLWTWLIFLENGPVVLEDGKTTEPLWVAAHWEGARLGVPSWLLVVPYTQCQSAPLSWGHQSLGLGDKESLSFSNSDPSRVEVGPNKHSWPSKLDGASRQVWARQTAQVLEWF